MKKYKLNELVQATGQAQEIGETANPTTAATPPVVSPSVGGALQPPQLLSSLPQLNNQ